MYTAYGPRGLYWNPASPLKLTWSELDRSNFACACSEVTSLVSLERKETQPFFGTSLKKIGESMSVHELRQVFSVFWGKLFRNQAFQEAGIKSGMMRPSTQLRDFEFAAFLQECLLLEHRTQRGISELRSVCVQLVLSKSRICSELGTEGLNAAATAGFEPRTVWSEVRRRNRLATAPPFLGPGRP